MARRSLRSILLGSVCVAIGGGAVFAEGGGGDGGALGAGAGLQFAPTPYADGIAPQIGDVFLGKAPTPRSQGARGYDFSTDIDITFTSTGIADNGLTYGTRIELDGNTDPGYLIDEAFIYISGDFGRLGFDDDPAASMLRHVLDEIGLSPTESRSHLDFDTSFTGRDELTIGADAGTDFFRPLILQFPMGDGFHADSGAPPPNDAPPEFSVAPGGQWGVTVRDKVNYVTPTIAGFSASTSWDAPLADQPPLTLGPDLSFSGSYGNYGNATLHARYADAPESQPTPAPSTPPATPTRAVQKAIDVIPDEFLLPQYRRNPSPETYRLSPGVRLVGGIFWFDDDAGNRMSDSDIALTAIVGSF